MRKPSKKTVLIIASIVLPLAAATALLSRMRGRGRTQKPVRV